MAGRRTRAGPANNAACQLPPPNNRFRDGGVALPTTDPGAAVVLSARSSPRPPQPSSSLGVRELRLGLVLEVRERSVHPVRIPDDALEHRRPLGSERARQQVRAVERERLGVAYLLGLLPHEV